MRAGTAAALRAQGHLGQFATGRRREVWVFDKLHGKYGRRPVASSAFSRDYYALPGATEEERLALERDFARLENLIAPLVRRLAAADPGPTALMSNERINRCLASRTTDDTPPISHGRPSASWIRPFFSGWCNVRFRPVACWTIRLSKNSCAVSPMAIALRFRRRNDAWARQRKRLRLPQKPSKTCGD